MLIQTKSIKLRGKMSEYNRTKHFNRDYYFFFEVFEFQLLRKKNVCYKN